MRTRANMIIFALVPFLATTSRGAGPDMRPIAPEQVRVALAAAGLSVSTKEIAVPAGVVANGHEPALRVAEIARWGDDRLRARVECEDRTACLPFLVTVIAEPEVRDAALKVWSQRSSAAPVRRVSGGEPEVRAGASARLLLEGEHLRIEIPVICLQDGQAGQRVRVTSKDRRQTYSAEVTGSGQLKGILR